MPTFPNLPAIGASQVTNAGTTSNDADAAVVNALANPRAETVDNTNAFTITNAAADYLWERNISWRFTDEASPPTAQITLTVPTTPARGLFGIINATGQAMQVETSAQVLTAPVIAAGDAALLSNDGTNVELLSSGAGGGSSTFEALTDAFAFAGNAGKVPAVNSGETALEAVTLPNAVNVPPSVRHVRTLLTTSQAITAATDTDVAWDGTEESTAFDPQDGGATQRMWLGANWTFADGDVTVGTDVIAETAHGYQTGEGPIRLTNSGGALPAGLAVNTNYWIIAVDANTVALATSRVDAIADTRVDITAAAGGGTHTVDQEDYLVVPANVAKVEIAANADWATATDLARQITIKKRNASDADVAYEGRPASRVRGQDDSFQNIKSDAVSVAEGDRFVLEVRHNSATSPLNLEATDMTWFSMRVMEETAAFTYPGVTVTPPWRGATYEIDADKPTQDFDPSAKVPWDSVVRDTDGFDDVANDRFVIPAGVTKVAVTGQVTFENFAGSQVLLEVFKNGVNTAPQRAFTRWGPGISAVSWQVFQPYLEVVEGDTIELLLTTVGDSSVTLSKSDTWFHIEVIETAEAAFPPEDVSFFVSDALFDGALPTTGLIYKNVAARRFTLSDDFAGSVGHSEVAATGATVFDVNRNGAKIGEINVANTAQVTTFTTTAAAVEVFDVGDRFEVAAPSAWNAIDELAISFWAWRS